MYNNSELNILISVTATTVFTILISIFKSVKRTFTSDMYLVLHILTLAQIIVIHVIASHNFVWIVKMLYISFTDSHISSICTVK